jgi:hypothetical protein
MTFDLGTSIVLIFGLILVLSFIQAPGRNWIMPKSEKAIPFSGSPAAGIVSGALLVLVVMAVVFVLNFLGTGNPGVVNWLCAALRDAGWDYFPGDPDIPSSPDFIKYRVFVSAVTALISIQFAVLFWSLAGMDKSSIRLSAETIEFPWRFFLSLKGRLRRSLKDVSALKLQRNDWLEIYFSSGGSARINLREISERDRELLLYMALRLNPACEFVCNGEKTEIKSPSATGPPASGTLENVSFTELWCDRFQRLIISTTFVPLSTGENILSSKYSIVKQLATTAITATYAARNQQGQSVVIKELATGQLMQSSGKVREMFLRECALLSGINHPRICKVLDTFSENERDYLVLEYLPGKTARNFREREGKPSELSILKLAQQMCEILQYLHEQEPPIIHRDISPENWIIDSDLQVFLIDFGAANTYLSNVTRTVVGKSCYMAPEQVRGKAGFQSDVYGLGATLYYLITGEEPEALTVCRPGRVDQTISVILDKLVSDCTQLECSERIQSMAELKVRIEGAIQQANQKQANRTSEILHLKIAEPLKIFRRDRAKAKTTDD